MKRLLPVLMVLGVFLGSVGGSESAEPIDGICLPKTKHAHSPMAGKCSASYEKGDYETALREFRALAEQGNAEAQNNLGVMYRKGLVISKDYETAVKWYRLAAEQGNAVGQYNLGLMYKHGAGVPKDDKTAMKWFKLSAEQGDSRAIKMLDYLK